ncbi:MAG: hypothetical protein H5T64_03590 [Chloroflexi bacterium]|nr:hypothetical protein [Chloroflexota bacterium]
MQWRQKILATGVFAITMAYLEGAVVVYLRQVYNIEDVVRDYVGVLDQITFVELGREAATLIMLLAFGWAVGRCLQDRIGYAMLTFGVWDITYYGWLRLFLGWPRSLLEWDVLFLLPLPWWGPVIAPMLIAFLMALAGVLLTGQTDAKQRLHLGPIQWGLGISGALLCLYTFMADAIAALPGGLETVANVRPSRFNWPLFWLGYALLCLPVWTGRWVPESVRVQPQKSENN